MVTEIQNQFLEGALNEISGLEGIDVVYALDGSNNVISEINNSGTGNYLSQVVKLISLESVSNEIGNSLYEKPFKTCTLLNEDGLMIITKIDLEDDIYIIIVAGEAEPVDLINLLRMVKELTNKYYSSIKE